MKQTVTRTKEQMEVDRERVREMVRILTAHLDLAGIPYERIIREFDAAIYVPAIDENQVMVAMVGLKGAVPMQLCRREPGGGQYQSTDDMNEAVRLIKGWMRPSGGRTIRAAGKATLPDRSVCGSSGAVSGRSEVEGRPDGRKVPKRKRVM